MLRAALFYNIITLLLINTSPLWAADQPVPLKKGMLITHSVTIEKGTYQLDGSYALDKGVIEIKGDNIVVDFNGAVLQGSKGINRPDEFFGNAIRITGGSNIIIKNAVIKGYKIGIRGSNINNIKIEHCDLSYNFRQHLNSNRQREDLSDWQSYHHNEHDEWTRFGAAVYLRSCDSLTFANNIITGGQCGLMMTQCDHGLIYNNNISFNSGIGIGFYRSSYNKVMNNKLDWNVRGVSYGVYYRGQDAAAILVYEQSSHNIFAYNSATHSGDGFFLWAGASTLATGKGGCNDNLIYGNDFSYAPTNGIEVTFSRNKIINNKVVDCDYGVWGGYSHNTLIAGNTFADNHTGVAIEQGQDNIIKDNEISGGRVGVQLWATPGRQMEGQYDARRDVRSMHYQLTDNKFDTIKTAFIISHSEDLAIQNNNLENTEEFIRLDSSVKKVLIKNNNADQKIDAHNDLNDMAPTKIAGAQDAMLPDHQLDGKQYIMMTEWGPYDFRSPMLWWTRTDSSGKMYFKILGPAGKWKLKKQEGVEQLSAESGAVPGTLTINPRKDAALNIQLTYSGKDVVSPFGKKFPAGSTYQFGYQKLYLPVEWQVKTFAFDSTTDPVGHPAAFKKLIQSSKPLKTETTEKLEKVWWDGLGENQPQSKIASVASGRLHFKKGTYVLGVSAGDIVRVYVDNKMVINAWDTAKLVNNADYHQQAILPLKGWHTIRVEQAQYGGYGMLYLTIKPEDDYDY